MNQFQVTNPIKYIETRIQFLNFGVVDTIHETFRATVLIKARWRESSVITNYDRNIHWNPLLSVENGQTISTVNWVEQITYELTPLVDGTEVTEIRKIEGDFWERFELADFPLGINEFRLFF